MSQLEDLKTFHFNPAALRKNQQGGGRKYRCNAIINIQIHYNLLFIDPQVLLKTDAPFSAADVTLKSF